MIDRRTLAELRESAQAEQDAQQRLLDAAPDLLRAVRLAAKLFGDLAQSGRARTADDGEGGVHDLLLVAEDFDDLIAKAAP